MIKLHDFILGTENWDVFSPMTDFVLSGTSENHSNSKNITASQSNSSLDYNFNKTQSVSELLQFPCDPDLNEIEETAGILLSPNYPQNYPNISNCGWKLIVPSGYHLILQFWSFDVWELVSD